SSFSPKDALTPLSPSTPSSLLLLRRWRLPLPTGSRPAKSQAPLWLAQSPLVATGLAAGGSPLRAPYSWPPLRALRYKRSALLPAGAAPCRRRWPPFRAGPSRGQPYMGAGRGWPPLLFAAFTVKMQ
ncbi:hypothetical protein BHE74_00028424, partial [Ensete ventricosum]